MGDAALCTVIDCESLLCGFLRALKDTIQLELRVEHALPLALPLGLWARKLRGGVGVLGQSEMLENLTGARESSKANE